MPKISTSGRGKKRLFHNELITVYERALPLKQIEFWPENNRTQFTFELLEREEKRRLKDIPLDKVVKYIARTPQHKLDELAASIRRNGVRVPLIVLDDGTLLDGNRRFFACHLLRLRAEEQDRPLPEVLDRLPVWVIKESDINSTLKLKILAEANFVEDLKVPWPLDAKARAVQGFYDECVGRRGLGAEEAMAEIKEVFAISAQRAQDYLDTMKLAADFVAEAKTPDERYDRRQIVESAFVYFWEFRNKAMKGAGKLAPEEELPGARALFFKLMLRQEGFANIKEIEPFVRARRDRGAWAMLVESSGTKLPQVVAMMNQKKALRRAEDRLQVFLSWLEEVSAAELSEGAVDLLQEIVELAGKKLSARRAK